MTVRVRFAPSPTGFLHVGSLRTILFDVFYAKQQKGSFILRIEDTDQSRFVEGAVESLLETLSWLGIELDEGPSIGGDWGPYFQSQRLELYQKYAQQLIQQGDAYYAFDTAEEIEAMRERQREQKVNVVRYNRHEMKNSLTLSSEETQQRIQAQEPYVIRLKVPEDREVYEFEDLVRGSIQFGSDNMDDQVLIKADGFPTYHLAVVVDDHHMQITHIVRGEEWLPSTPKHIYLYELLGWEMPKIAHTPLLLGKDGRKLSKRDGSVDVREYIEAGFEPHALINYLALLGWSDGTDKEIFTREELIAAFSFEAVNPSGAIFDVDKLTWFNKQTLYLYTNQEMAERAIPWFERANVSFQNVDYLEKVCGLMKERLTFIKDLPTQADFFFGMPQQYDEKTVKKRWNAEAKQLAQKLVSLWESIDEWTDETIKQSMEDLATQETAKLGVVMSLARLLVTGQAGGPDLVPSLELLGKQGCISKIQHAIPSLPTS